MKPTILAIIPARGGSKSVPRKNILTVAGKPLIAWTIETALNCAELDRVIVSTDNQDIAEISRQFGADVPFLRPPELAQDTTSSIDTIIHAIEWLEEHETYRPDYVMMLQPTSPLRTAEDIKTAIQISQTKEADGVVSICFVHHHPYWTKCVSPDGRLVDFLTLDVPYTQRQELPEAYALSGAIYLVRREILLNFQTFYTDRTYAYIMPSERSLDIDTSWDLHLADLILRERNENG